MNHASEDAIFADALALPEGKRAAFLDRACAGDTVLRAHVERLLKLHEDAGDFLESPPPGSPDVAQTVRLPEGMTGDKIGRYKLLQKIGEGGCGVVYMAEQEEPVRRRVALKVIKLGMDTKSVIARFEAERQALAMMEHSNIAKVLDAGATDAGRPFFVMELVRGIKITDYCDQNNLSTEDRLKLFAQVCHAIQHAHQKGIIHRDIKPSNILVTLHDGVPVPKVIDFGIAKATQGRLTDATLFTAFEQFMGTPAYMSPEQAEMSGLDIDTRSDIYSLGVLLYELLAGRPPFEGDELLRAGIDAMRKRIREEEPPRPSARLSTLDGNTLTTTAKHRQIEPLKLIRLIRGDLDWIVMRCLEKDRTRRYETANGLAVDIQRYLSSVPVVARPPSAAYRFQKLVQRNKLLFASASAIAATLVVGTAVSIWQAVRATRAEREQSQLRQQAEADKKRAQTEASKSQQVAQFLKDMLYGSAPMVGEGHDLTALRQILDRTAERVGIDLTNQPEVEADLRFTIGSTYLAIGEFNKAVAMDRESLRLRKSVFGETNVWVAASLAELARALTRRGQSNDLSEAEATVRQAVAMWKKLLGDASPEVASSVALLAGTLLFEKKLAEAEIWSREALAMRRHLFGTEHPEVASSLDNLALVLRGQGKLDEAEAAIREALAMQRKLLGNNHKNVLTSLTYLAGTLDRQNKQVEAETVYREALALQRKLYQGYTPYTESTLSSVSKLLHRQGREDAAETLYIEELAFHRKELGAEHPSVTAWLDKLADLFQTHKKYVEAENSYREALLIRRKVFGNDNAGVAQSLYGVGLVLHLQGRDADAEPVAREMLALIEKLRSDPRLVSQARRLLGAALAGQQKFVEAEPLLLAGFDALIKLRNVNPTDLKLSAQSLAHLYTDWGQPEKAAEWKKKLAELETPAKP